MSLCSPVLISYVFLSSCPHQYHQVSVYNVFVERGNVAVLQCGVPASVRDSVEVRKKENSYLKDGKM